MFINFCNVAKASRIMFINFCNVANVLNVKIFKIWRGAKEIAGMNFIRNLISTLFS
jgi:hypothetical protein